MILGGIWEPGSSDEFLQYCPLVGSLMWPSVMTRPDIGKSLHACACPSYNPSPRQWKALLRIVAFVNFTNEMTGMRVDTFSGNEGAKKAIANNLSSTSRSKHVDAKLYFIRSREGSSCLARVNGGATCRCPHETLVEEEILLHRASSMNLA